MPTATNSIAIRCHALVKRYKDVVAVAGLYLEVTCLWKRSRFSLM